MICIERIVMPSFEHQEGLHICDGKAIRSRRRLLFFYLLEDKMGQSGASQRGRRKRFATSLLRKFLVMEFIRQNRLQLALESLRPTDGFEFEKFANAFLAAEFPDLRPVAGIHDGGRD